MCTGGRFDPAVTAQKLTDINAQIEDSAVWADPAKASSLMQQRARLSESLETVKTSEQMLSDAETYLDLLRESMDDAALNKEAENAIIQLQKRADELKLEVLLSGEADGYNAYVEIHPGAGGTESQDWAEMLERMYRRWAERRNFKVLTLDRQDGDGAGIKSVTLQIMGRFAYGWLKSESGVHRLVRISPFDSNARRHTSFASVWVYPEVDESITIEVLEKDLRIDVFRASGPGGQGVNTTDSAVRITHTPTNIVVQCQSERSQIQNRARAMKILQARLYELELQKRQAAADANEAAKTDIGWGHQIRSYVLQPYQMVKDARTDVETSDTQGVLDGDINQFIEAYLQLKATSN